jgi:hypothetical protein
MYAAFLGSYSYQSDSPACLGHGDRIDPITIVATHYPPVYIQDHVVHHGFGVSGGIDQDFREWTQSDGCTASEINLAAGSGSSRWHIRGHQQVDRDIHPHRSLYVIAGMTPHWDQSVPGCGHQVPEDYYGDGSMVSGFDAARIHVRSQWLASGHHIQMDVQVWDNTLEIEQGCNGWMPESNGVVYFLSLG